MVLENKLGITSSSELANVEEKISKKKALELFELGLLDWSKVDKEDYLLAMERSPIKDVEIKVLLNDALTDKVDDREVYMKGIDASYNYEGYNEYRMSDF